MTVTISHRFPGHRTLDEAAGLVYDHQLQETHPIGAAARAHGREARGRESPSTTAGGEARGARSRDARRERASRGGGGGGSEFV